MEAGGCGFALGALANFMDGLKKCKVKEKETEKQFGDALQAMLDGFESDSFSHHTTVEGILRLHKDNARALPVSRLSRLIIRGVTPACLSGG